MKRIFTIILSVSIFVSIFVFNGTLNVYALQDDVYKAYKNELLWIGKLYNENNVDNFYKGPEYCVYDINKDGIKELCVKSGMSYPEIKYDFYTCEYGKIIRLGEFIPYNYDMLSPMLYACNGNGIFVYGGHTGFETLYKISKNGHSVDRNLIFSQSCNYNYHPPKTSLTMYSIFNYSGLA